MEKDLNGGFWLGKSSINGGLMEHEPFIGDYPVVIFGSDQQSERGVSMFPTNTPYEKWTAVWSYLEFPNHLIVRINIEWDDNS